MLLVLALDLLQTGEGSETKTGVSARSASAGGRAASPTSAKPSVARGARGGAVGTGAEEGGTHEVALVDGNLLLDVLDVGLEVALLRLELGAHAPELLELAVVREPALGRLLALAVGGVSGSREGGKGLVRLRSCS